ncbi:uncharacterized protein LOC118512075 [Anopheles stephensi]|uniref:uncharacterized protein LOC118512075 n=1 Tax=Anopheles stephensi TaxID=30069 RepID=UPI001658B546|nr:uncharacterized protein LOC118512075 [Anopheles stephensi]XP_035911901.1 uncharacterized protein LOC118512075 [Anopheles stephensi]XP_035911902.1 uncharacterized protein LOC118512075 [Anopheles stephensi]XP_035911903.1 uncharacterized protein LOC118512075 [Anopheles stephensi]XP_035911904.1 uncharacterized protein LOC118512075 [Anopheles stephensi]XP_035911905.1 uncharacterized protein LOC118512075 [Anopheles stephensi]
MKIIMMHQPSRVLHQSSVPLRSMSQPASHQSRSATVVPTANQTTSPYCSSKGSQQYTKFRNNRSASSSRVLGGLQAPIKAEAKVDCRRKSGEVRLGKNGNEDESFATDRIPKMKLLKVNYVHLTNDEAVKKPGSDIDKTEAIATSIIAGNHGKALKEDVERKKMASTGNGGGGGSKVVNSNAGSNLAADHQPSAGGPFVCKADSSKECKKSTSSKETETPNGDPGKGSNSKYLVYKKHNGFGANSSHTAESSSANGGKLQYINDSDIKIKALAKKKYGLLFENKKKSKLETVQYYFDSRGYERYVDNKLYGVINERKSQPDGHAVQSSAGGSVAMQTKSAEMQQKRQSWDAVRHHNRPSMMRVINQSSAAKKCANVIMLNHQTSAAAAAASAGVAKPMSAEAPERLGAGDLKQENCRMFKLQKSHTSTNLLTRHKSMNDIHRINQLFLESRDRDPDPLSGVSFANRQNLKHANNSGDSVAPHAGPVVRTDVPPVHRFEKHRKTEQGKYLVHKRLSARYKTESNLPNSLEGMRPASTDNVTTSSCTLSGDDTISKRIRKIIDDHQDHTASTETIDQQPDDERDEMHELDKQKAQSHHASAHPSSNENIAAKKFRRLSKSKSADKLWSIVNMRMRKRRNTAPLPALLAVTRIANFPTAQCLRHPLRPLLLRQVRPQCLAALERI